MTWRQTAGVFVLVATAVAASSPAFAALPTAPVEAPRRAGTAAEDPRFALERGFARMSAGGGLDDFLSELAPYIPGPPNDEKSSSLRTVFESHDAKGGPPLRAELIRVESAGPSFARYHYLQVYSSTPLIWSATFTRADGRWRATALNVTSKVAERRELYGPAELASGDLAEPTERTARFASLIGIDDRAALEAAYGLDRADATTDEDALRRYFDWIISFRTAWPWEHRGVELARLESLSPSLVRFVYVEHSPKDYIVWEFVYYRAHDEWELIDNNIGSNTGGGQNLLFPGSSLNPPANPSHSRK